MAAVGQDIMVMLVTAMMVVAPATWAFFIL
jgi:hypothetical protein